MWTVRNTSSLATVLRNFKPTPEEIEIIKNLRGKQAETSDTDSSEEEAIVIPDMSAYSGQKSETSPQTPGTSNHKMRNLLLGLGGGALAGLTATVAIVAGIAKGPSDNRTAEDTHSSTLATAKANQSSEADPLASGTPSAAETAKSAIVTLKQTTSVEAMSKMTIEEFAKLSFADRFAYMIVKSPDTCVNTPADDLLQNRIDAIPGACWQAIRKDSLGLTNTLEGSKLYAAMQYYTTNLKTGEISPEYKATVDSIQQTGGHKAISDQLYEEAHGEWQAGVDRSGHPIEFAHITYHLADRSGKAIPNTQVTSQAIRIPVKTLDGNTYIAYAQGYTADGTVSPDDKYPY